MRGTGVTILSLVLAAAVVLTAGCSGGAKTAEKSAEAMMEKALNQAGDGSTKLELGAAGTVDLSGLPENLRYPGAKPLSHVSSSSGDAKSDTYILQTGASVAEVAAHFKQSLPDWKQIHTTETGDMVSMAFESPDGAQMVSIMIGGDREKNLTTMNVTISAK
jgi:hypothetical protein